MNACKCKICSTSLYAMMYYDEKNKIVTILFFVIISSNIVSNKMCNDFILSTFNNKKITRSF